MKTGRTLCLLASVGTTAAFLFPFPANNKAGEKNGRPVETRNIQADKWMTPDTPAFDFKASLQQVRNNDQARFPQLLDSAPDFLAMLLLGLTPL